MIKFFYLLLCSVVLLGGCASLPQVIPLSEPEAQAARQSFGQMLNDQWSCPGVVDADVSVTFKSFIFSGAISGYLQAMRPSSLRFEGVNPFGLTETVLVTNGSTFSYVAIREQQGYEGSLLSATAKNYIPADLSTHTSFYWLIGKLPPGKFDIFNAGLDAESGNIWFDIKGVSGGREKILYSEKNHLVLRHLALDEAGEVEIDVTYTYPPVGEDVDLPESCPLPQNIVVSTKNRGKFSIELTKTYPDNEISEDQFSLVIPSNYKRTVVK